MQTSRFAASALLALCASFASTAHSQSPANTAQPITLATVDPGDVSHNAYHNLQLGFTYDYPSGWTVNDKSAQTKSISQGNQLAWAGDLDPKFNKSGAPACSKTLFMATEHPIGMTLDSNRLDSSALLIAADPHCLNSPFPTSVKDQPAIQKIAGSLGIYFKTFGSRGSGPVHIRAFEDSGRVILEISQKYLFSRQGLGNSSSQVVYTTAKVIKSRGLWLMWMFATSDDQSLDRLRNSPILFEAPPD